MSIRISVEQEENDIVIVAKRIEEKVRVLMMKLAEEVKGTAFILAPRRTGRLAESIRVESTPEGGLEVIVDVPYAAKVERDAGFFFRAVSETEERVPEYLRSIDIGP